MTTLIQSLRNLARHWRDPAHGNEPAYSNDADTVDEAADEIERIQDMMTIADSAIGVDGRRIAELEAIIKDCRKGKAELQAECGKWIVACTTWEESNSRLQSQVSVLEDERTGAQTRIAELEAEVTARTDDWLEVERLKAELKAAREEQTRLNSIAVVTAAERDSIYKKWEAARERIAAVLEITKTPNTPPCDCVTSNGNYWSVDCECGNPGDLETAARWAAQQQIAEKIRAAIPPQADLVSEPEE